MCAGLGSASLCQIGTVGGDGQVAPKGVPAPLHQGPLKSSVVAERPHETRYDQWSEQPEHQERHA